MAYYDERLLEELRGIRVALNKQNEILEEEIKDKKYRKEENKKDIKFTLKLIPILTII